MKPYNVQLYTETEPSQKNRKNAVLCYNPKVVVISFEA